MTEEVLDRVVITKAMVGICFMQVCALAEATDEEILALCNRENPAGTTNGWASVVRALEEEPTLITDAHLPVVCGEYPERRHFLVAC
jgi:hypothetical protein